MKPAAFAYHAPRDVAEALALLARYGDDARPLAGGQSLVPLVNMRVVQPKALIDLKRCADLPGLVREGDRVVIGAMVRQAEAEQSPLVAQHCPLLAAALPLVGGQSHRNCGTVCGSLAHADPLAELPAVAVALDAEFEIHDRRRGRRVAARDFFVSDLTTAIEAGELLVAVRFPVAAPGTTARFLEVGNRGHGFALAGIAAQVTRDAAGRCTEVRLGAMGVGATPIRLDQAEALLTGQVPDAGLIQAAADAAGAAAAPRDDLHASAAYRRQALATLVGRALTQLCGPEARP